MSCRRILGGHALGYHIDVFGTNFPEMRTLNMNMRQLPAFRGRKTIYPINPTLRYIASSPVGKVQQKQNYIIKFSYQIKY